MPVIRLSIAVAVAVMSVVTDLAAQTAAEQTLAAAWWQGTPADPEPTAPAWVRDVIEVRRAAHGSNVRQARPAAESQSFKGKGIENAWRATAFAELAAAAVGGCAPLIDAGLPAWQNGCRAAGDALTRAVRSAPGFAPAVAHLTAMAPYPEVWAAPADELRHLDLARRDPATPAETRRLLTRTATLLAMELEPGDAIRARVEGDAALWSPGERAWLEAFALGVDGQGARALAALDAAAAAEVGDHQAWIARDIGFAGTVVDSTEWAGLPAGERATWLRRFWTSRDEIAARPHGARWAEHVMRYRHVHANYRAFADGQLLSRPLLKLDDRIGICTAFQAAGLTKRHHGAPSGHATIDMRGALYMRHGEPTARVNFAGPGNPQERNDAWLYVQPEGSTVAIFCRPFKDTNLMIAQPIASRDQWESLCQVSALYCVLDGRAEMMRVSAERLTRIKEQGLYQYRRLDTSDSHDQRFERLLPSALQLVGMSGPQPAVLSVIEIPMAQLKPSGDSFSLRWQVYVTAPGGARVAEHDTTRTYRTPPRDGALTAALSVPVPPGDYTVTTIVSTADNSRGAAIRRSAVTVLDDRNAPGISDIVLYSPAERGLRGAIAGDAVHLSPSLVGGGGGRVIGVGYVARGLADTPVRVSVAVRLQGSTSPTPDVSLTYTDTPTAPWQWRGKELSLEKLDPGAYDLELSVTLPSNEVLRRVHQMIVR